MKIFVLCSLFPDQFILNGFRQFSFVLETLKDGINFHGNARFDFQIVDGQDRVHWTHDDTDATLGIGVNGRYSVNIGGQGMNHFN